MRVRQFPAAVEIDGVVHDPVLVWADDSGTSVWSESPDIAKVADYPPTTARERHKGHKLSGGQPTMYALDLEGGGRLVVGRSSVCGCKANRWALYRFNPASVPA